MATARPAQQAGDKPPKDALAVAKNNIYTLLTKKQTQEAIAAALPDMGITPQRVATIAYSVIASRPDLLACTAQSLVKVIAEGCLLGLSFDPHLKQAHIVPFKNKGVAEATLIIGYMGLVKLARNAGILKYVDAHVVYSKDGFDFELGLDPKLEHKPPKTGDRGEPIGVYAIGKLTDGDTVFRYLTQDEVYFYREKSRAKDASDSPWNTDEMSQWRKTAIRRLVGYLPMDDRMARAVVNDELAETGHEQRVMPELDGVIDIEPIEEKVEEKKSKTEERKQALRDRQKEEQKLDEQAEEEGRAGTLPADAPVETPEPSPQAIVGRDELLDRVNNALGFLFKSNSQADIAISEATKGKVQSKAALQDADAEVLDIVHKHLLALADKDLPK